MVPGHRFGPLMRAAWAVRVFGAAVRTAITGALFVGYGTAFTPTVTSFNGRTLLQGAASNTGPSKTFPTGFGAGLPLGGPTGWKLAN